MIRRTDPVIPVPRFSMNILLRHSDYSLSVSAYSQEHHVPTSDGRNIRIQWWR